jgi:hypothetical protein
LTVRNQAVETLPLKGKPLQEEFFTTMGADFIDDLLQAVHRVFKPVEPSLKEILIISGMPEETQNLRYLSYNRQVVEAGAVKTAFSAVALINNRRAKQWSLKGYFRKMSQVVFNPRWTRNELDLFINALRCSPDILTLLGTARAAYTLLGILEVEEQGSAGIFKRWARRIRPVLAVPGIDDAGLKTITAFEHANEIRRSASPKRSF